MPADPTVKLINPAGERRPGFVLPRRPAARRKEKKGTPAATAPTAPAPRKAAEITKKAAPAVLIELPQTPPLAPVHENKTVILQRQVTPSNATTPAPTQIAKTGQSGGKDPSTRKAAAAIRPVVRVPTGDLDDADLVRLSGVDSLESDNSDDSD